MRTLMQSGWSSSHLPNEFAHLPRTAAFIIAHLFSTEIFRLKKQHILLFLWHCYKEGGNGCSLNWVVCYNRGCRCWHAWINWVKTRPQWLTRSRVLPTEKNEKNHHGSRSQVTKSRSSDSQRDCNCTTQRRATLRRVEPPSTRPLTYLHVKNMQQHAPGKEEQLKPQARKPIRPTSYTTF